MESFNIKTQIYFGDASLERLSQLKCKRVFIVTDPFMVKAGAINKITDEVSKGDAEYLVFSDIVPEPPIEVVVQGIEVMMKFNPEVVIALGGGSAIDAAKAICSFSSKVQERMDIEKLVDMITREVMNRIPSSTNNSVMEKAKVLVISSCTKELMSVKELVQDKYEVLDYNNEDVNLKNYDHIIITNLCNNGLSSLALGLCNNKVQAILVEALFNSKRVYVLKEGIQYRNYSTNANEALYNLYNQYECKIMSYGANIVQESDLACSDGSAEKDCLVESSIACSSSKDMHSKSEAPAKMLVSEETVQSHQVVEINNKRLITESDLRKLYMNGIKEVNLIKKAILTPLAQDFIRIKRLKINREVKLLD